MQPFHMPGHKRNPAFLPAKNFMGGLLAYDLTEIPCMDNLHDPNGVLDDMNGRIAKIYGAGRSYFLTNGSSSGICAAICSICSDGEKIMVARNCHRSVFNAIVMAGAVPVYIQPKYLLDGSCGSILPDSVVECFGKHNGIKAVVVTSPTYSGSVSDIKTIADTTHCRGAQLIVDEAHGAHFPFHHMFPRGALSCGADFVVNSLHKTLPAPSQCAVLHTQSGAADAKLLFYIGCMTTTSPSYMLMSAADHMLFTLDNDQSLFVNYVSRLTELRNKISSHAKTETPALILRARIQSNESGIFDTDISKLHIEIHSETSGEMLYKMMENNGIQLEMADVNSLLAVTSAADTKKMYDIFDNVYKKISQAVKYAPQKKIPPAPFPVVIMRPKEAVKKNMSPLPLKECAGRISGQFIIEYPPGIPLLCPGELITDEIIDYAATIKIAKKNILVIYDD